MKNLRLIALLVLSVAFLFIGILGIANVPSFGSNAGLEILEIVLGIGGIVAALK